MTRSGRRSVGELSEQMALARALDAVALLWCHVPNGGYRSSREAVSLRQSGVKAGVPDVLVFSSAPGAPRGVALELKASGGALRPEQREWLDRLGRLGWATVVAYGYEDAVAQLRALGYGL